MLHHGSKHYIENLIEPRVSFDYKPFVYATDDFFYALVRAGDFVTTEFLIAEVYLGADKPFKLVELVPGAFNKLFNKSGYIYILDNSYFKHNRMNEYVSEIPVPITFTGRIDNILAEMNRYIDHYDLVSFENSDSHWRNVRGGKEGYLRRREERLRIINS